MIAEKDYYTYEDWIAFDDGVRAEIVDGQLFMMETPSLRKHRIFGELFHQIANFLQDKPNVECIIRFGVRLRVEEDTVFVPEIQVVCDRSKLGDYCCNGAPDLIVEILSPSTARYDRIVKFNKYQAAGVREYWMVEPDTGMVHVSVLEGGSYRSAFHDDTAPVPVTVLPGCEIDLKPVFAGE